MSCAKFTHLNVITRMIIRDHLGEMELDRKKASQKESLKSIAESFKYNGSILNKFAPIL